jgi:hypothetical protein
MSIIVSFFIIIHYCYHLRFENTFEENSSTSFQNNYPMERVVWHTENKIESIEIRKN